MKYSPGDKVLVRSDLTINKEYYMDDGVEWNSFTSDMARWSGKVVTIKSISYSQYKIEEQCNGCFWVDGMFAGLAPDDQGDLEIDQMELISVLL